MRKNTLPALPDRAERKRLIKLVKSGLISELQDQEKIVAVLSSEPKVGRPPGAVNKNLSNGYQAVQEYFTIIRSGKKSKAAVKIVTENWKMSREAFASAKLRHAQNFFKDELIDAALCFFVIAVLDPTVKNLEDAGFIDRARALKNESLDKIFSDDELLRLGRILAEYQSWVDSGVRPYDLQNKLETIFDQWTISSPEDIQ